MTKISAGIKEVTARDKRWLNSKPSWDFLKLSQILQLAPKLGIQNAGITLWFLGGLYCCNIVFLAGGTGVVVEGVALSK